MREIWTIFRGDIAKCISENLAVESILKFTVFSKLKTEKKKFHRQVKNVTGPESQHLQLPEPIGGRCIRRTWKRTGTLELGPKAIRIRRHPINSISIFV